MDFLSGILGSGGGTVLLVQVALVVLAFVLPNKVVHGFGVTVGKTASLFLRQKAGKKTGEKVEGYFQGTLNAFASGINEGLDADDADTEG